MEESTATMEDDAPARPQAGSSTCEGFDGAAGVLARGGSPAGTSEALRAGRKPEGIISASPLAGGKVAASPSEARVPVHSAARAPFGFETEARGTDEDTAPPPREGSAARQVVSRRLLGYAGPPKEHLVGIETIAVPGPEAPQREESQLRSMVSGSTAPLAKAEDPAAIRQASASTTASIPSPRGEASGMGDSTLSATTAKVPRADSNSISHDPPGRLAAGERGEARPQPPRAESVSGSTRQQLPSPGATSGGGPADSAPPASLTDRVPMSSLQDQPVGVERRPAGGAAGTPATESGVRSIAPDGEGTRGRRSRLAPADAPRATSPGGMASHQVMETATPPSGSPSARAVDATLRDAAPAAKTFLPTMPSGRVAEAEGWEPSSPPARRALTDTPAAEGRPRTGPLTVRPVGSGLPGSGVEGGGRSSRSVTLVEAQTFNVGRLSTKNGTHGTPLPAAVKLGAAALSTSQPQPNTTTGAKAGRPAAPEAASPAPWVRGPGGEAPHPPQTDRSAATASGSSTVSPTPRFLDLRLSVERQGPEASGERAGPTSREDGTPEPPRTGTAASPAPSTADLPLAGSRASGAAALPVDDTIRHPLPQLEATAPDRLLPEPAQPGSAHRTPLAAHRPVPDQIAQVVRQVAEGSVEIRLSPEELGRVRMTLLPREDGLAVTLTADRPETLDLMRRHGSELNRALTAAGYETVDLTFSGGGARRGGGEPEPAAGEDRPVMPEGGMAASGPARGNSVSAGLDLRL